MPKIRFNLFTKNFYKSLDHYCLGNQIFEDDRNTFFINVKKTSLPQRIVLDFDNCGEVSSLINIFVNLESGAKFEVLDESKYSRNSTLRIFSILNNRSEFEIYKFNDYSKDYINSFFHFSRLNEYSVLRDFNFSNGSKHNRCETIVNLDEPYSSYTGSGTIISKSTHSDNIIDINHNSHSANSDCFFKTVSSGESMVSFDGNIYVGDGSSNTVSNQVSKGLLIDEKARINLVPKLEINNDDVMCSHGAASGKLDDDTLFYLTSRGISEEEAKRIYTQGFLGEFTEKIDNAQMKVKAKQYINKHC